VRPTEAPAHHRPAPPPRATRPARPAQAQTPPGVLVVGQIAEPQALDPHAVTAVNDFRILMNVYDGLVRYASGTLEVEPALATDWEISDDGTVYTFTLREGVTFHDGSAFNAEAVVFNFDRMLNEDHPYHDTGPFPLSFFFSSIESVEATWIDMTVTFTLNAPYAPFLSNLAYPTGPDRVARGGDGAWRRFRPQPVRHRALHLHRMALERGRGDRGEPRLLGRRAGAAGRRLPPDHRRQHPHRRDAGGRHRRDGRGAAGGAVGVPGRRVHRASNRPARMSGS
jgi:hypothetical protein